MHVSFNQWPVSQRIRAQNPTCLTSPGTTTPNCRVCLCLRAMDAIWRISTDASSLRHVLPAQSRPHVSPIAVTLNCRKAAKSRGECLGIRLDPPSEQFNSHQQKPDGGRSCGIVTGDAKSVLFLLPAPDRALRLAFPKYHPEVKLPFDEPRIATV